MKQIVTSKSNLFGAPSIALILMTTGLTIFALLALRSSLNEQKMAKKAAESSKTYFELSGILEEAMAEIDERCAASKAEEYENVIGAVPCVTEVKPVFYRTGKTLYYIDLYTVSEQYEHMAFTATVKYEPDTGWFNVIEWKAVREENNTGREIGF